MSGQRGFTLIEVLLALALAGILGVSLPGALSTANRATVISNEHTVAESIARSQIDYIQNQAYDRENNPPIYSQLTEIPEGYSFVTSVIRRDPKGDGTSEDDGLQQITVTVKHGTKTVFTLVDFKVDLDP